MTDFKLLNKNITEIYVNGKRWFQKSYGNTYHTVKVDIYNGTTKKWQTLQSGIVYGYDNHFEHTAAMLLLKEGIFFASGTESMEQNAYKLARKFHIDDIFTVDVMDVNRKKDL